MHAAGYYYDNYGLPPLHETFENFLNLNCVWWNFYQVTMQAPFPIICGQYCGYFLSHKCREGSVHPIVSRFPRDLIENVRAVLLRRLQTRISVELVDAINHTTHCNTFLFIFSQSVS